MTSPIHIRYLQTLIFMTVYICLGFILRLKTEAYLLLGIPLTFAFQLFIIRQPIHKLLLRDEQKFHLNKLGWTITLFFLIYPVYKTTTDVLRDNLTLAHLGFNFATILGAFCAGFCYSKLTKKTTQDFLFCFAITALIRTSLYFLPFLTGKSDFNFDYIRGIKSLLTYIPVAFVVEEVIFRGMLDTYIHPDKNKLGLLSALFISLLWGLWHMPLSNGETAIWLVAASSMTISLWGIILSIFWRRSGNLAVPGFSHAFADAIRDAFK